MVSRRTAKAKGSASERQLLHKFYEIGWAGMRAAGSGSIPLEVPDILVGNGTRALAIEIKTCAKDRQYLQEKEIQDLITFSRRFGAEPWVGVKFDRRGWHFLRAEAVKSSGKGRVVAYEEAKEEALRFEELIEVTIPLAE